MKKKNLINEISGTIDKRSTGYKRRLEALQSSAEQMPEMIQRAMGAGIEASYMLMDTWSPHQPLARN